MTRKEDAKTVTLEGALIPINDTELKSPDGNLIYTKVLPAEQESKSGLEKFLIWLFTRLNLMEKGDENYFRWVSIWYFWKRIGSFRILKARIKERERTKGLKVRDTLETEEETVDFLVWKSQRPVLAQGVNLYDRSRCDILVNVLVTFLVPRIPVFVFKHRFYSTVDSAIEAAVIDYCRNRNYSELVSHVQTGPSSDFFQRALSRLNAVGVSQADEGFVKGFGILLVGGWIAGIELSTEDSEIQEAAQAKEIAIRTGIADVEAAKLRAQATVIDGEARATALKLRKEAAGANFGDELQIEARSKTPSLTTLVEKGAVQVTVQLGGTTEPKAIEKKK